MPFSLSSQLSEIVGFAESIQPKSILDVGVGMGQYGFLLRTNIEHFNLYEVVGEKARRRDKSEWNIHIDGIEAYPGYITPVHEYAYNNIYFGDALEVMPKMDRQYNLVLAIDILEHFEKRDGLRFIDLLKRSSDGKVLISTPKDFIEQHVEANPYENHRSHWTKGELEQAGCSNFLLNKESWIGIIDLS